MSITPDLSRIIVARLRQQLSRGNLEVYDVSTGLCLAGTKTSDVMRPLFTHDGREVWVGFDSSEEEWEQREIIEDSESGAIEIKLQHIPISQVAGFRESSSGYEVTDSGWVLSPSQKRLLWLPHRWRSDEQNRAWDGRLLGLLHGELSEAVILECLE